MIDPTKTPNYSSPAGGKPFFSKGGEKETPPLSNSRTELPVIGLGLDSGRYVLPPFTGAMGPASEGEAQEPWLSGRERHSPETVPTYTPSTHYNAFLNGLTSFKGDMEEDRSAIPGSGTMSGMSLADGASPEPNEIIKGKGVKQRWVMGEDSEPPKYTTHTSHNPPYYPPGIRQGRPTITQAPTKETWPGDRTCQRRKRDRRKMKKPGHKERELPTVLYNTGLLDTHARHQIGLLWKKQRLQDPFDLKVTGCTSGGDNGPQPAKQGHVIVPIQAIPVSQPENRLSTTAEFEPRFPDRASTTDQVPERFTLTFSEDSPPQAPNRRPAGIIVEGLEKGLKQQPPSHDMA